MKTILVDDEWWTLSQLCDECSTMPDVQIMGKFDDASEALEFAKENTIEMAFLDVEMPGMNGLELAKKLRELYPELIVIFVSAYDRYMTEAFRQQADYFVVKPYTHKDIVSVFERAKLLVKRQQSETMVQTFGAFEVFVNGSLLDFDNAKAKELLALIIDRQGVRLKEAEAIEMLWNLQKTDEEHEKLYQETLDSLFSTLKKAGIDSIIQRLSDGYAVKRNDIDCDLFKFLDGDTKYMRLFNGKYLDEYQWAGETRKLLIEQSRIFARYTGDINNANDINDAENMPCAMVRCIPDEALTLSYINQGFLDVTGYKRKDISEKYNNSLLAMVASEDREKVAALMGKLADERNVEETEFRIDVRDGGTKWLLNRGELRNVNGAGNEIFCIMIDISGNKQNQEILKMQAERDTLTGLYNRMTVQKLIEEYIAGDDGTGAGALVLTDIDNFKNINDTYGHPFGDSVIMEVAQALKYTFRTSDYVGRSGGDEMMIFVKDLDSVEKIVEKLNQALNAVTEKTSAALNGVMLTCSFGASLYPRDGKDFAELYKKADVALYHSKENGKRQVTIYNQKFAAVETKNASTIESEDGLFLSDQFVSYMFNQLYFADDINKAVKNMLGITCRRFDAGCVYIIEFDDDKKGTRKTFSWCEENFKSVFNETDGGISANVERYISYIRENGGILQKDKLLSYNEQVKTLLSGSDINDLLQVGFYSGSNIWGVIGFEQNSGNVKWSSRQIASLTELAHCIGIFLENSRMQETIEKLKKESAAKA